MNYFDLFEIPNQFIIDENILRSKYYTLCKSFPEKQFQINEAYRILKDPIERCKHLLEIHHIVIQENPSSLSPEFLLDMLELHEEIQVASTENNFEALKNINNQIDNLQNELFDTLNKIYFESISSNESKSNNVALLDSYYKLKYYNRLKNSIEELDKDNNL